MAPLKALGLDGLHAQFYQIQWDVIGESLVAIVWKGFEEGHMKRFINKTLFVLIPKVAGLKW